MIIYPSEDGYVILDSNDHVIAGPFVTITETLEEGIEIDNLDDVMEWLRPDVD